jgi:hypothetical protein
MLKSNYGQAAKFGIATRCPKISIIPHGLDLKHQPEMAFSSFLGLKHGFRTM